MFNIVRKNGSVIKAAYHNLEDAQEFLQNMGPQRNFYRIEEDNVSAPKTKEAGSPSQSIDTDELFKDAVEITRANVKFFHKKEGLIRVLSSTGKILHTGKTKNMGKVFSNYVNCARYNQSYDFDLEGGDRLYFKETTL